MIKMYSAEWCGPCKGMKALIAKEGLDVTVVDIGSLTGSEEARGLGVQGVPMFYNTETKATRIGSISLGQLKGFIDGVNIP